MTRHRRILRSSAAGAAAAALALLSLTPLSPATAAPGDDATASLPATRTVDGRTQATAAASCWEIKELTPDAPSGAYWLQTPAMDAPQQFHCDQETDGGGWVRVAQGREGWVEHYEGQGDPTALATQQAGPESFKPVQLPSRTVDELLDGARPDELSDGMRIRRAKDRAGNQWQEVRVRTSNRPRWNWTLGAKIPVTEATFDGQYRVSGYFTNWFRNYWASATPYQALRFQDRQLQNYVRGFAYADGVDGTTDPASHLWAPRPGVGAIAFSQMSLRPRVRQTDFEDRAFPQEGTAAREQRALPSSRAEPTTWGAVGRADGGEGELNTEVQAFAEVGDTVFAGGNFAALQRDERGTGTVDQQYLAAFDSATGELRTEFRPTFDGQVKTLAVLPGDRLAVGGLFSSVNGVRSPGLVVLDPRTGEVDTSWKLRIENLLTSGVLQVRGLDVRENTLYIAGSFTHLTGGTDPNPVYARGAAKVDATDGTPDRAWNPNLNGTATDVDASEKGDRVYTSGYFSQSGGTSAYRLGAFPATGAASVIPWGWTPSFPPRAGRVDSFQFAVQEVGDTVWAGGAEHSLFGYDREGFHRTQRTITEHGGDMQSISSTDDTLYASCHCGHFAYAGAEVYPVHNGPWNHVDRIDLIGAWDARTGARLQEFNPRLKGHGGWGIWASLTDKHGVLWGGGDLARSETVDGSTQWSGGLVRFAPRDSTAPSAPGEPTVTLEEQEATPVHRIAWEPVSESGVTYQVLSGGRTVAVTSTASATVPAIAGAKYAVRAVDAAGNLSASTRFVDSPAAPAAPAPEPPAEPYELIAEGSEWAYRFAATAPQNGWSAPEADTSTWATGATPLGLGSDGLATAITRDESAPRSVQLRREVTVENASELEKLELSTRADDGVVVYVNGTEVARSGLPDGPVNHATWATAAPRTSVATRNPVTVDVPGWLLRDGTNVIAAEVHSNWSRTPDLSFDLSATAVPREAQAPPETPGDSPVLVPAGAEWAVRHEDSAPAEGWFRGPVDPAWRTLTAPVGWGQGVHSVLRANEPRPVSTQLIREFHVDDPTSLHEVQLSTLADDGVIVWLNGTEVARRGLPAGDVAWNTYATQAPSTAAAAAAPLTVVLPASSLVEGKNTVAVQTHVNYRSSPDSSAELTLEALPERAAAARMAEEAGAGK